MLTGSEVPDQKSVIRFRLTMSLSALPRSSLEEESQGPRALETAGRVTWMGALTTSEPGTRGSLVSRLVSLFSHLHRYKFFPNFFKHQNLMFPKLT